MTLSFAPSEAPTLDTRAESPSVPAPQAEAERRPSAQEHERARARLAAQKLARAAEARAARERAELQSELSEARTLLETQRELVADLHERLEVEERKLRSKSEAVVELERRLLTLDET